MAGSTFVVDEFVFESSPDLVKPGVVSETLVSSTADEACEVS